MLMPVEEIAETEERVYKMMSSVAVALDALRRVHDWWVLLLERI